MESSQAFVYVRTDLISNKVFSVLAVVVMKSSILWDKTSFSSVKLR
jgi:hypothetical protein